MRMVNAKALVTAACVLALGMAATACSDPQADAKAQAEAKEKADKTAREAKLRRQIDHDIECLSALRWQDGPLQTAGIGGLDTYNDYYKGDLDQALGLNVYNDGGGKPVLSRPTLEDYLNWSYAQDVARFTGGPDTDGDGKVSSTERTKPGFDTVALCVQFVAEVGKGPLAGKDKAARMFKIQYLRGRLKDKGA